MLVTCPFSHVLYSKQIIFVVAIAGVSAAAVKWLCIFDTSFVWGMLIVRGSSQIGSPLDNTRVLYCIRLYVEYSENTIVLWIYVQQINKSSVQPAAVKQSSKHHILERCPRVILLPHRMWVCCDQQNPTVHSKLGSFFVNHNLPTVFSG